MIGSTRVVSVFVYTAPTDMRKSFNTLGAIVEEKMDRNILSGDMFVFVSKNRTRAKVLFWDGTGLCLYAKRLERNHFKAPWKQQNNGVAKWTMSELMLFLEGSEFAGRISLSPEPFILQKNEKNSNKRSDSRTKINYI